MKQLKHIYISTTLFVLILVFIPLASFAFDDNIALHMGLSSIFGAVSESILHHNTNLGGTERVLYGTIIGSFPGFAKEVIDSTHKDNYFSGSDMAADIAGVFIGAVIANFVNNKIQVNINKQQGKTTVSLLYRF